MSIKTPNHGSRIKENSIFTTPKLPSSRRTPSISSSSSSNSFSSFRSSSMDDSPPPSPSGGIPFSWESIPGIPKHQILKKIDSSRNHNHNYLPLPPAAAPVSRPSTHKKYIASPGDPFFAAFVEVSKGSEEDDDKTVFGSVLKAGRHGRSLSARFGFVNSMNCKNASAITESLVLLPRGPRRIAYDVVKKRAG